MRVLRSLFVLLLFFVFLTATLIAQDAPPASNANVKTTAKTSAKNGKSNANKNVNKTDETKARAALDEAKNAPDIIERIEKLKKFLVDFPQSESKTTAAEMLVVSHAEAGEMAFRGGDNLTGADHFRAAVKAFIPEISDGIFNDIVAKLPFNLFYRNERTAALEIVKEIQPKVTGNAPRILALANFYLTIENADEAKRLAARAAEIAPDSAAAQMTLGMAHRINFHLEAASQAYARALELDAASVAAKRNLADAWRGLGQNEDALKLYRELLEANPADEAARNGLVLTLFNLGNKEEAEKELTAALEQNPKNLILQASAAYWYATNGDGKRAVELANKAVETEPRYVWGQIALARGLILERRPLEAERALLVAKQYGNFPTLDYELASTHFAAGLYEEAADDLRRAFNLKNGKLEARLAGRADAQADNFIELLSRERRASIFQPNAASGETEARKLKELLALSNVSSQENADQAALIKAAQDFSEGDDDMSAHRRLYAANKLLDRKIALSEVLELTRAATNNLEKSLDVSAPTAAALAEELYEPRRLAQTRGAIVNIPDVPRETLRQIMRGRVEEIAGWALYQQNKPEEAAVRLRRAVSVLPENSAWWRSSYWKLGSALDAAGKSKDALDAYIKSYKSGAPSETRLAIIEGLYQRIYGTLDGLEARLIQTDALNSAIAQKRNAPTPTPTPNTPATFKNPLPNVIAQIVPPKKEEAQKSENASENKAEATPEIKVETKTAPVASPETTPKIKPETAEPSPAPEIKKTDERENKTETAVPNPEPTPTKVKQPETKTEELKPTPEISNKTENPSDKTEGEKPAILTPIEKKETQSIGVTQNNRPRVVIRPLQNPPANVERKTEDETNTPEAAVCIMQVSQSQLSILRNGGTASLLVTFGSVPEAEKLVVTSSSPNDIRIIPRTIEAGASNRRLFQIYSTSEITKIFTITLESPCGTQEVKVRVR